MYVVTRLDLPMPHLLVQACHAAMAATNVFGFRKGVHPNLVVCTVADEEALNNLFNELKEQGIPCCGFNEADFCGALTAIATAPLVGKERAPLRQLKLLKGSTDDYECSSGRVLLGNSVSQLPGPDSAGRAEGAIGAVATDSTG